MNIPSRPIHRIGVISDTHGLVRPSVLPAFQGADLILHAGDVGGPEVIASLESLAPVIAVAGNMDPGDNPPLIPAEVITVGPVLIYMRHDLHLLDMDPAAAGFRVVITGHTHLPHMEEKRGVLYLNPGSAGPRRFNKPVSLARLTLEGTDVRAEIVSLE